jgi:hypothetical protein
MQFTIGSLRVSLDWVEESPKLILVPSGTTKIKDSSRVLTLRGVRVLYQLKDNFVLTLKLQGKSMHGNPVDFKTEDITAVSADPTIITVTEANGEITVTPVGPLGTTQVQVTVPSVQINNQPLSGNFDVQIIAGDVDSIAFTPDTTVAIPDPNLNPPSPPPPVAGP